MIQDRLPTNERRSRWSSATPNCSWCNNHIESILHITRDCKYARVVWQKLVQPSKQRALSSKSLIEWVYYNLKKELGNNADKGWAQLCGVVTWKLWNWRNMSLFQEGFERPTDPTFVVLYSYKNYTFEAYAAVRNNFIVRGASMKWQRPMCDWLKFNVDGAVTINCSRAACGRILRNHEGEWVAGFSKFIGSYTAVEAEEWAIWNGLLIAWDLGIRKVVMESDCKELVDRFNSNAAATSSFSSIWQSITGMCSREWICRIQYVCREANSVADKLAKEGLSGNHKFSFIDMVPNNLRTLVQKDIMGSSSPSLYLS